MPRAPDVPSARRAVRRASCPVPRRWARRAGVARGQELAEKVKGGDYSAANRIISVGAMLPNSAPYWADKMRLVRSMNLFRQVACDGDVAAYFITTSLAENYWHALCATALAVGTASRTRAQAPDSPVAPGMGEGGGGVGHAESPHTCILCPTMATEVWSATPARDECASSSYDNGSGGMGTAQAVRRMHPENEDSILDFRMF